jgi:hypothetical protein
MVNSQNRPSSRKDAPDPASVYERAKPEKEAGMGRLDNERGTPTRRPDHLQKSLKTRHQQSNALDTADPHRHSHQNATSARPKRR